MKSLKLDHKQAEDVLAGRRTSTWRINDDKDLHVNDQVTLIDKADSADPATWQQIGVATIVTILEKQLGSVTKNDMDGEVNCSIRDVIKTYQGYYGPQVSAETPVKIIRFSFESGAAQAETEAIYQSAKLFADGGSRGNPGPSASGYVIYTEDDKIIAEKGLFLGVTTNNQAEYQALKLGLEDAVKRGIDQLSVFMDSLLVVNQVKGSYKVKNPDLRAVHASVMALCAKFKKITFMHVPRERNKKADSIVNEVLDAS